MPTEEITDFVWCVECGEPHGVHEDIGLAVDANSFNWPCMAGEIVRKAQLPPAWELSYAEARYDEYPAVELLPHGIRPNPEFHRRMRFEA